MKIKILFFAQLRDALGETERALDLVEGSTLLELKETLFSEKALIPFKGLPLLYAVNEDYVAKDYSLKEGDVVSFLPPVAGG